MTDGPLSAQSGAELQVLAEDAGTRPLRTRKMLATYTEISLLTPTFVGVVLVVFDGLYRNVADSLATASVVLIAAQQAVWLRTGDYWPRVAGRAIQPAHPDDVGSARWRRAALLPAALIVGLMVCAACAWYGIGQGRPVYFWAVPAAAQIGIVALAFAEWDREQPRWSVAQVTAMLCWGAVVVAAAGWGAVRAEGAARSGLGAAAVAALLMVVAVVVQVGQVWWERVVSELTKARESLISAALTEERLRFAGELHDVQGNHLQVIMVRAELASQTLAAGGASATGAVSDMLGEIRDDAQRALQETRAIAYGFRSTSFAQEVANTEEILRAAGIAVSHSGGLDELSGPVGHLAGLAVREATTNLLRHSLARSVSIDVAAVAGGFEVRIADPGPARSSRSFPRGAGLASLAERAANVGYTVDAGPLGEGWQVVMSPLRAGDGSGGLDG